MFSENGILGDAATLRTATLLKSRKDRLEEVTKKLERQAEAEKKQQDAESGVGKSQQGLMGDWTKVYTYWKDWDDVEELKETKAKEEENLRELSNRPDFMGHYHDHSEERKIFELPEDEKLALCERHRALGNHLYLEGLLPKAAEQYQTAMSYYEYCFPDDVDMQVHLEELRHACLCNISLCYLRMGNLREAVESATHVIEENPKAAKAYYRRARAYRMLDEYENAEQDLRKAAALTPLDKAIEKEMNALQSQRAHAYQNSKVMASMMLGTTKPQRQQQNQQQHQHENQHENQTTATEQHSTHTPSQISKEAISACQDSLMLFNLDIPLEPLPRSTIET